jgi:hypothetical protein
MLHMVRPKLDKRAKRETDAGGNYGRTERAIRAGKGGKLSERYGANKGAMIERKYGTVRGQSDVDPLHILDNNIRCSE